MAVDAVGSSTSLQSNINMQDFLRILLTQLSYQDPLKPMDNTEFVAQMAQFSALEQGRQLNEKVDQLVSVQLSSHSVGLLGKNIDVNGTSGSASGQVVAMTLASGEPKLTIRTAGGQFLTGITIAQILAVR